MPPGLRKVIWSKRYWNAYSGFKHLFFCCRRRGLRVQQQNKSNNFDGFDNGLLHNPGTGSMRDQEVPFSTFVLSKASAPRAEQSTFKVAKKSLSPRLSHLQRLSEGRHQFLCNKRVALLPPERRVLGTDERADPLVWVAASGHPVETCSHPTCCWLPQWLITSD